MSAPLLARVPPQSLEAEQATLGAMLFERAAIVRVAELLRPDDFYSSQHQMLYRAMRDLFSEGDPVDLVTLQGRLRDRGQLEQVGGVSYLLQLQEMAPTAAAIQTYARIVGEKATLRRLIHAGEQIRNLAQSSGDEDVGTIVERCQQEIVNAGKDAASPAALDLVPWEAMLDDPDAPPWRVPGLLPDGGLAVMAGEGGDGKGWWALMVADAVSSGEPFLREFRTEGAGLVLYVDGERGRRYMAARVKDLSRAMGRRPNVLFQFRPRKLDSDWLADLVKAHRPALLIVDSLSRLLPPGTKDTDNAAMSEVLGALRDIAERFACCVLVIHHFKKRGEFSDNRPVARVRGATSIVNVADVVIATAKTRDGLLKIEVVKSYWGDPADPFLCDWQPGEQGGTSLVYAGPADPERVTKLALAQEIILGELEGDVRTREYLETACKKQSIPKRTFGDALRELQKAPRISRAMDGKRAVFGLVAG